MLRKACYALVAGVISTTAVSAADYRAPSHHNWSGPYIGAHFGAVFGDFNNNFTTGPGPFDDFGGPSGGVLAGYNWQQGNLVFGLEADFSVMDIRARTGGIGSFKENYGFSIRGRLGMAMDEYLVYATAGWSFTDKHMKLTGIGSDHKLGDGVIAGAGIEGGSNLLISLGPNWIKRLEYLYNKVEKDVQTVGGVPTVGGSDNHTIRAALIYRF